MGLKEQLEGMSYDARQMAIEAAKNSAVGNVSPGLPGWRKLITGPIDKRVNYDGQFMTLQTEDNQRSRKNQILAYSAVYPLWLWVRALGRDARQAVQRSRNERCSQRNRTRQTRWRSPD